MQLLIFSFVFSPVVHGNKITTHKNVSVTVPTFKQPTFKTNFKSVVILANGGVSQTCQMNAIIVLCIVMRPYSSVLNPISVANQGNTFQSNQQGTAGIFVGNSFHTNYPSQPNAWIMLLPKHSSFLALFNTQQLFTTDIRINSIHYSPLPISTLRHQIPNIIGNIFRPQPIQWPVRSHGTIQTQQTIRLTYHL